MAVWHYYGSMPLCDCRSVQALRGRTSYLPGQVVAISLHVPPLLTSAQNAPFRYCLSVNNRLGPFGSFSLDGGLGVVDRVPEWTLALPPHLAQSRGGKDSLEIGCPKKMRFSGVRSSWKTFSQTSHGCESVGRKTHCVQGIAFCVLHDTGVPEINTLFVCDGPQ